MWLFQFINYLFKIGLFLQFFLLAFWIFFMAYYAYHAFDKKQLCVKLPHGLYIRHKGLLNPIKFLPIGSSLNLEKADGEVLVAAHIRTFYMTETTIYGRAEPFFFPDYGFAYRPDIGFVRHDQAPTLYQQLIDEAGTLIDIQPREGGDNYILTNLRSAYYALRQKAEYKHNCHPTLF